MPNKLITRDYISTFETREEAGQGKRRPVHIRNGDDDGIRVDLRCQVLEMIAVDELCNCDPLHIHCSFSARTAGGATFFSFLFIVS